MRGHCENCGCATYDNKCTNCHEELYIMDQYHELSMELPNENTEFMKSVRRHEAEVSILNKEKHSNV